jgi:hypothetical protein
VKIIRLETFLTNAGLRNYLFVHLTTDTGLTGVGEASLEWQERTVETLIHEWVEDRILGADPFDVERVIGNLIRDQSQGGPACKTRRRFRIGGSASCRFKGVLTYSAGRTNVAEQSFVRPANLPEQYRVQLRLIRSADYHGHSVAFLNQQGRP